MGTVYEAIDLRFESQVSLKETHFTEEALRKQFEREAHLLYKLRHPAIARVIDHFTEGDGQYLVMDFIEGDDLWEMLEKRGGAFSIDEVLTWADQLLEALRYLHQQDPPIIHRDIKPQNLKLSSTGQIILLDFGLAKGFAGQISRVTTSGSIFGYTPNYAPLEQIHGTGTDAKSDLYSLAATLYHLLTGKVPPDALSRATAIMNEQPDPLRPANEIKNAVPALVAEVLHRAMSNNSSKRQANAVEMRDALRVARKFIAVEAKDDIEELPQTMVIHAPPDTIREEKASPFASTLAEADLLQGREAPNATVASPAVTTPVAEPPKTFGSHIGSRLAVRSTERKSYRLPLIITGTIMLIGLFFLGYAGLRSYLRRAAIPEPNSSNTQAKPANQSQLPSQSGKVNDYANIIEPRKKEQLENTLSNLKKNKNVDFLVVTVKTIGGQDIYDYSLALARGWGVAAPESENKGIILLIAFDDRKYNAVKSKNLEGVLPDSFIIESYQPMLNSFNQGKYGDGITKFVNAIITKLNQQR